MSGGDSTQASAEIPTDSDSTEEEIPDNSTDFSTTDTPDTTNSGDESETSSEKPFDDEPFDAGVEADEDTDPKKFIEQLTGKLGQSLRKYTEEKGQPDFELEKFAINSLLSATHTGEMDNEDQKDIIKKVKKSGIGDDTETDTENNTETDTENDNLGDEEVSTNDSEESQDDSENLFEDDLINEMSLNDYMAKKLIYIYDNGNDSIKKLITRMVSLSNEINKDIFLKDLQDDIDKEDLDYIFNKLMELNIEIPSDEEVNNSSLEENFFLTNPPKNNMFQEGSNDILDEENDRCTRIAKRKYKVWPSAYASGAVVKCRQGKIWKGVK